MRPFSVSYTPTDDSTNGLATAIGAVAGVAFVQQNTSAADNVAHLIIITPSGSITGNFTITGTDADGNAQTEVLATSTTNPVTSAKYYLTVTSVLAPSGIASNTVQIGWTDDVVTPTLPIDWRSGAAAEAFIDISGTIDVTLQELGQSVWDVANPAQSGFWLANSGLTGKSADVAGSISGGRSAVRILTNSVGSGGKFTLHLAQGANY